MESIKQKFKEVISYSQEVIPEPQVDELFDRWAENKRYFLNAWNGPTYEVGEVSFELTEESKEIEFNNFIYHLYRQYSGMNDLTNFLQEQGYQAFFDNTVKKKHTLHTGVVIPAGSKLIRAFKFFVKNENALRMIQDEASVAVQKNKVSGTLVLSVHPLDYLSSSENTYRWRSCHSLDGEFRAGNLSYMIDSATIICYLKGEESVVLPNFPQTVPWNSKKWRMLLFSNDKRNLLFAGKQYPFSTDEALEVVRNAYLDSIGVKTVLKNMWSSWHNDFLTYSSDYANGEDNGNGLADYRYYFINNGIYDKYRIIKDVKGSHHFNDLLRSSTYVPYYCWLKEPWNHQSYKIKIGGPVKCLRCGEENICVSDSMLCEKCELHYGNSEDDRFCYCELCGSRHFTDDTYWIEDVGNVCPHCLDEYCVRCDVCGQYILSENANSDYDGEGFYCDYCIDDVLEDQRNGRDDL